MDTERHTIVTSSEKRQSRLSGSKMDLLHTTVVVTFFLFAMVTPSVEACPSGCQCGQREVWCNGADLTKIPPNLPVDTRHLYLFNNKISNIAEGSLSRLRNLQLLDLSMNRLTNQGLRSNELSKLTKLEELMLGNNKISTVSSGMFAGMTKLVRLYLNDNEIQSVEQNAIRNMSSLLELILSNNNMQTFPKITNSPKLQRLCLDGNRLTRLQFNSFEDVNLEELTLAGNRLTQLPATAFKATSNLRTLDISQNSFRNVPEIIRNMTSLGKLNLSANAISSLPANLIHEMLRLKELDIHSMRLTTLAEGFIPRGVYFNWADFSDNSWTCDCAISWLYKIMRQQAGVFVKTSKVRCHQPASMREQTLKTVQALNCKSNSGSDGVEATKPGNPVEPQKPPTYPDTCPFMACKNGATCYMNGSRPVCRCLPGWRGLLCNDRIPTTSTTTFSTTTQKTTPSTLSVPRLHFDPTTLTEKSVAIFMPKVGERITVTVSEVVKGQKKNPRTFTILPPGHKYTVTGLSSGKRYRICITMRDNTNPAHVFEDTLCGEIATPGTDSVSPVSPENTTTKLDAVPPTKDDASEPSSDPEQGESDNVSQVTNEATKAEFQLFYPVLGAGLGAFVILVVVIMFYVCYRNKQKLKHANNNDSMRPPQSEFKHAQPANETEMNPMIPKQRYMQQPAITTAMMQNGDVSYVQHPNVQAMCVSPKRVGTPPKNGSLGRSSNSGGSMSGAQVPYTVDRQRCYSTGSANGQIHQVTIEDMHCQQSPTHTTYQSNGGIYTAHSPYTSSQVPYTSPQVPYTSSHVPMLTNRNQDYVYRSHGGAIPQESYAETAYNDHPMPSGVLPGRATSTTVNQYHLGPISATSASPACTYRPINSAAVNGYAPIPRQQQALHYSPQKQGPYPNSRIMVPNTYGPTLPPAHIPAFQDTLVM